VDSLDDGPNNLGQNYAMVALLDDEHIAKVHQIWKLLQTECGLPLIDIPPYPHFSFHVAQSYRLAELDDHLNDLIPKINPFTIRTTGLSVFTGQNPVVYIPVVPNQTLLSLHQLIWDKTSRFGNQLNPYYQPDNWVPHITLIHNNIDVECLNCIFDQFIGQAFEWKVMVDKLSVIYQKGGEYGIQEIYSLQKS
jgi:2'-5' RNA ligase